MSTELSLAWIEPSETEGVNVNVTFAIEKPSRDELERLETLSRRIDLVETPILFRILEDAWKTFDGLTDQLPNGRKDKDVRTTFEPRDMTTRVLSTVGNFLSSARTYIDSSRSILKSEYTRSSSEFHGFDDDTRTRYDSLPGYRFTERLRNIFVHLGEIPAALHIQSDPDPTVSCLLANRDACLDPRYGWNAAVRRDILNSTPTFDIKPLLGEALDGYRWIERRRSMRVAAGLMDDLGWIQNILSRCKVPPTASPILISLNVIGEKPDRRATMSQRRLPSAEQAVGIIEALELDHPERFFDYLSQNKLTRPEEEDLPFHEGHELALSIMDRWHKLSPAEAQSKISKIVDSGPEACYLTLMGFMELTAISMLQIDMLLGVGLGELISSNRSRLDREAAPSLEGCPPTHH